MEASAHLKFLRVSPRKAKLVADVIRGLKLSDAKVQLSVLVKRSSLPIEKLLKSAVANAENNFGMDESNLFVSKIFVNEGPTLKRWMPRAMGRATQILKRTSHITIVLEEIEPSQKSVKTEKSKIGIVDGAEEIQKIKKEEPKIFGKRLSDQKNIHGSQNVDAKKKFQRRKAI